MDFTPQTAQVQLRALRLEDFMQDLLFYILTSLIDFQIIYFETLILPLLKRCSRPSRWFRNKMAYRVDRPEA